ncbi:hypothetical protein BAE44_0015488 [Dichanthelium oligosanthes]|uniref:Uncharacterized protein n=1 Tax=Dichanthelium oligosanthes TaxID=888268 RepID=A0A1E5VEC7_9POAL|nr:hypothetical protein BAE44_0015488 [Dichanthelium oligosanthes]
MASLTLRPIILATAASTTLTVVGSRRCHAAKPRRRLIITCKAEPSGGNSTLELAAGAAGLVSSATVAWSLYTLNTTGCGLPPGPGGALGAAEGVSYLVVAGLVGWSVTTKARTGSGLPAGPYGLLGAAEGVAYLTVAAIAVVFGLQFFQQGSIPDLQCFNSSFQFVWFLHSLISGDRLKTLVNSVA